MMKLIGCLLLNLCVLVNGDGPDCHTCSVNYVNCFGTMSRRDCYRIYGDCLNTEYYNKTTTCMTVVYPGNSYITQCHGAGCSWCPTPSQTSGTSSLNENNPVSLIWILFILLIVVLITKDWFQ